MRIVLNHEYIVKPNDSSARNKNGLTRSFISSNASLFHTAHVTISSVLANKHTLLLHDFTDILVSEYIRDITMPETIA